MKLQRCANGRFYDGDKYPNCPHCQDAGLPGFKDDETVTQPLNRAPGAVTSAGGGFGDYGGGENVPANGFDCGALETVTLGNSVRKIRGYAFFRCAGFDHIELPKSVVHIEEYAFYG